MWAVTVWPTWHLWLWAHALIQHPMTNHIISFVTSHRNLITQDSNKDAMTPIAALKQGELSINQFCPIPQRSAFSIANEAYGHPTFDMQHRGPVRNQHMAG